MSIVEEGTLQPYKDCPHLLQGDLHVSEVVLGKDVDHSVFVCSMSLIEICPSR